MTQSSLGSPQRFSGKVHARGRSPRNRSSPFGDASVNRANDYLVANIADNIGLDHVAHEIGLSPRHLLRIFRRATGLTPHQWRIRRRLEHARTLLTHSPQTIGEVAYACGFSSSQHLATAFKASTGVTPSHYRQITQA